LHAAANYYSISPNDATAVQQLLLQMLTPIDLLVLACWYYWQPLIVNFHF